MNIRIAEQKDWETLTRLDKHITPKVLEQSITSGWVLVAEEKENLIGWLRWNLFWDNTPFMNLLFVLEGYRGKGIGKKLVLAWEARMKEKGYEVLMTSTASNEYAQHFYEKLGYIAMGGFSMPGDPYELIFLKIVN